MEEVEALIAVAICLIFGLLFLFIIADGVGASQVNHSTENVPAYEYTEEEYITLFNYCVDKRNAKWGKSFFDTQIRYMDKILNSCRQQYHNPYCECNYTILCMQLLPMLDEEEQKAINFGRLNK